MGIEPINGRSENHGKTNNELSDFASRIQDHPDLARVLKGDLTMRNSYVGAYGGQQHAKSIKLLSAVFEDLGYDTRNDTNEQISAENIYDFQRICGIYDGAGGTLIGKRTLQALIIASSAFRSGRNWKKSVAGKYVGKAVNDRSRIQRIREKLSKLKIAHNGFDLRWSRPTILEEAYSCLGFDVKGDNLRYANYKFQIISDVNNNPILASNYGLSTHKALITALRAAEKGKDWKTAF